MKTGSEAVQPANYEGVALETCILARKTSWKDLGCYGLHISEGNEILKIPLKESA